MTELELSIFDHGPEAVARLRSLLDQFEAEQRVQVHLEMLPWEGGWSKLARVALYRDGPDVSEIGSTWVGDFVRMDALNAFKFQEIQAFGGQESFLDASWQSGALSSGVRASVSLWAVPWLTDTRVVFYRRDLLEKAGVDEGTAFRDAGQFERTLARLEENGVQIPFVMPTRRSRVLVHHLVSWVWSVGGDFLSPDGKQVVFNEPQARQGIKAYFGLGRYLAEEVRQLRDIQSDEIFWRGKAAVALSGPWMLLEERMAPDVKANLGIAPVPGVPFVGGFHLAIWRHSRQREAAVKLVEFLAGSQATLALFPLFGLPAHLDALADPVIADDPMYRVMGRSLKTGRSFSSEHLWGLVETRLTDTLPLIWNDVLAMPEPDLDEILDNHLNPLARRIVMALNP